MERNQRNNHLVIGTKNVFHHQQIRRFFVIITKILDGFVAQKSRLFGLIFFVVIEFGFVNDLFVSVTNGAANYLSVFDYKIDFFHKKLLGGTFFGDLLNSGAVIGIRYGFGYKFTVFVVFFSKQNQAVFSVITIANYFFPIASVAVFYSVVE